MVAVGPVVATCVKLVPSVDRWILSPVALAALFVHFRLICDPETAVAARLPGAAGARTALTTAVAPRLLLRAVVATT